MVKVYSGEHRKLCVMSWTEILCCMNNSWDVFWLLYYVKLVAVSLVPRPNFCWQHFQLFPDSTQLFSVGCWKRESLVHEITYVTFRWKGDYRSSYHSEWKILSPILWEQEMIESLLLTGSLLNQQWLVPNWIDVNGLVVTYYWPVAHCQGCGPWLIILVSCTLPPVCKYLRMWMGDMH